MLRVVADCDDTDFGLVVVETEDDDAGKLWVGVDWAVVAADGVGAWLMLEIWLSIPIPSVNDLEKETLVLKIEESACFEALTAPVLELMDVSRGVVGWEVKVDRDPPVVEVMGLEEVVVAAPGPSPKAGTLPTCFEVATLAVLFGEAEGEDGVFDGGNTAAELDTNIDEVAADEDCLACVAKVLESIVAAPGPSPNAGTLPTCFEPICEEAVVVDNASIGNVEI